MKRILFITCYLVVLFAGSVLARHSETDDKNSQYLKLVPKDGNKAPLFLSNEYFIRIEGDEKVTLASLTTITEDATEITRTSEGGYSCNLSYTVTVASNDEVNTLKKVVEGTYCNGYRVPTGYSVMLYNKASSFDNAIYYLSDTYYILSVNGLFYIHNISIINNNHDYTVYKADAVNSTISGSCENNELKQCTIDENNKNQCENEKGNKDIKIEFKDGKLSVLEMSGYVATIIKGVVCSNPRLPTVSLRLNITINQASNQHLLISDYNIIYTSGKSKYLIYNYTISSETGIIGSKFTITQRNDNISGECDENNNFNNCNTIKCDNDDEKIKIIYLYYDYASDKIIYIKNADSWFDNVGEINEIDKDNNIIDSYINSRYCNTEILPLEKYIEIYNKDESNIKHYITDKYYVLYVSDSDYYVYSLTREDAALGSVGTKFKVDKLMSEISGKCENGKFESPPIESDKKLSEIYFRYKDSVITSIPEYDNINILNETENQSLIYTIDKIIDGKYCNKELSKESAFKLQHNEITVYFNYYYYIYINSTSNNYRIISDSKVDYDYNTGTRISLNYDKVYSDVTGCCSSSNNYIKDCTAGTKPDIIKESVLLNCFKRVYENSITCIEIIGEDDKSSGIKFTVTNISNNKEEMDDYLMGYNCNYYTHVPSTVYIKLESFDSNYKSIAYFTQNEVIILKDNDVKVYNITKKPVAFQTEYVINNYLKTVSGECINESMNYCYFDSQICNVLDSFTSIKIKNEKNKVSVVFGDENPFKNYIASPVLKSNSTYEEVNNILNRNYCNEKKRVTSGSVLKIANSDNKIIIYLLDNNTAVFIKNTNTIQVYNITKFIDNKVVGTIYSIKEDMIKERSGKCESNKFTSCFNNDKCENDGINTNITIIQDISEDNDNELSIKYTVVNITGDDIYKISENTYTVTRLTTFEELDELYQYLYGKFCNGKKVPENSFILFENNQQQLLEVNDNIEILLKDDGVVYYYKDDNSIASFVVDKEEESDGVDGGGGSIYYIQKNPNTRDLSFTGKCNDNIFTNCMENPNLAICKREPENRNITITTELKNTTLLLTSNINEKKALLMTLNEQKKRITSFIYGKGCSSNNYNDKTIPNGIFIKLTNTFTNEEYILTDNYIIKKSDSNEIILFKVTKTQKNTFTEYTIGEVDKSLSGKCENSILKNCTLNSDTCNNIQSKPFNVSSFTLVYDINIDSGINITISIDNVTCNYGGYELGLIVKPIIKGVSCNDQNAVQNDKYLVITDNTDSLKIIYLSESHYIIYQNDYFYIYKVTSKSLNSEGGGSVYTIEGKYTNEISGICTSNGFINCNTEDNSCKSNDNDKDNKMIIKYSYYPENDTEEYYTSIDNQLSIREASNSEVNSIHRMLQGSYCNGAFVPPDSYFQILSNDNLTEIYLTDNRLVHIRNYEVFVHEMTKGIAPSGSGNSYTLGNVIIESSMKCNNDNYKCISNEGNPIRCIGEVLTQSSFNIKYINSKNIQLIRPENYRIVLIEDSGKKSVIDSYINGEFCEKKRIPLGSYLTLQNYKDNLVYFIYEDKFIVYDFYKVNVFNMEIDSLINADGNRYYLTEMNQTLSGYCDRSGEWKRSNTSIAYLNQTVNNFIIKNDTGKIIFEIDQLEVKDYNITISSDDNKLDVRTIMKNEICSKSITYIHTNSYIKITNNNKQQFLLTDFEYVFINNEYSYIYNVTKTSTNTKSTYKPTAFLRMCDLNQGICTTCENDDYWKPTFCNTINIQPPLSSDLITLEIQYYVSIQQLYVRSPSSGGYSGINVYKDETTPSRENVNNYLSGVLMNMRNRLYIREFSNSGVDGNYSLYFAYNRMVIYNNENKTVSVYRLEGINNDRSKNGSTFSNIQLIKERTGYCDSKSNIFNATFSDNDNYKIRSIVFIEDNDNKKEINVTITFASLNVETFNCKYDANVVKTVNKYSHGGYCNNNKYVVKDSTFGFDNEKDSPVYINDEKMVYTIGKKVYIYNFTKTDANQQSLYNNFIMKPEVSGYCEYEQFITINETKIEFTEFTASITEDGEVESKPKSYFVDDLKTLQLMNDITNCQKSRIPLEAYVKITNIKGEGFDTIYLTDNYFILYNSTSFGINLYTVKVTFGSFGNNYEAKELVKENSGYCNFTTKELKDCNINNYCDKNILNPHEVNFFNVSYESRNNQFIVNDWKNHKVPTDLLISFITEDNNEKADIDRIINGTFCKTYIVPTTLPPTTPKPTTQPPTTEAPPTIPTIPTTPEPTNVITDSPTTKPPLPFVPCLYKRDIYRYFIGFSTNVETHITPIETEFENIEIKYNITCPRNSKNIIQYDNENGEFTVNINNKFDFILCEVVCYINGSYNDGNTNIGFIGKEYKPFIDLSASSTPIQIENNTEFNVTLKVSYPTVTDENNNAIDMTNNQVILQSEMNLEDENLMYKLGGGENNNIRRDKISFNWEKQSVIQLLPDDQINDTFVTLSFKTTPYNNNQNNNIDLVYETHPIPIFKKKETCIYGSFDDDGICCRRKYDGELCTNVTVTYSFLKGEKGSFNVFKRRFINVIQNIIFKGSFYWSTISEGENDYKIRFKIRYIENVRNYLNEMGKSNNLKIRRELQTTMNKIDYIISILKAIYPNDEIASIAEEERVFGSKSTLTTSIPLPPEIENNEEFKSIRNKLIEVIKEVSLLARDNKIKADIDEYIQCEKYQSDFVGGDLVKPPKEDPWSKKYWYVILIIVLVVVILLILLLILTYKCSNMIERRNKEIRNKKFLDNSIPVVKVKEENKVNDENIYKGYENKIIMEGYLLKEGRNRVIDKWQRRYCVLYFEPSVLRIYESMNPSYYGNVYLNEKQNIPMSCYNSIEYEQYSDEFTLIFKVKDSSTKICESGDEERRIHFKVEGEDGFIIAKKWYEKFSDYKNQKPESVEAWNCPRPLIKEDNKFVIESKKVVDDRNLTLMEEYEEASRHSGDSDGDEYKDY